MLFSYMNEWLRRMLNSVIGATETGEKLLVIVKLMIKLTRSGDSDDKTN
jgi:hypothetical protein